MIEVIMPGTKNRVTCDFCGALISYEVDDIKEKETFFSQKESYFQKCITCPQCKNLIILRSNQNEIQTNRAN